MATIIIPVVQGDTLPSIKVQLLDGDGEPVVIPATTTAICRMFTSAGVEVFDDGPVEITADSGILEYFPEATDYDELGDNFVEFILTDVDGREQTVPPDERDRLCVRVRARLA
jgi:hypothetical protein